MPIGFLLPKPAKTGLYLLNVPSSAKPKNTVSLYTLSESSCCSLACHAALGKMAVLLLVYLNSCAPSTRMYELPCESRMTPVNWGTVLCICQFHVSW